MPNEQEQSEQGVCSKCGSPSHAGHTPDCPTNKQADERLNLEEAQEEAQEMGIRQEGMLTEEQNQVMDSRRESQEQWETEAEMKNQYRSVWKRVFGIDKTPAIDIAVEEAIQMDKEIERLIKEGEAKTTEEAVEIADQQKEFHPKTMEISEKLSFLRPIVLRSGNLIEKNDFEKAVDTIQEVEQFQGVDDEMRQLLKEMINPLINKKIVDLVKGKDGKSFIKAFRNFSNVRSINLKDIGLSPEEFQVPEIVEAAKIDTVKIFKEKGLSKYIQARKRLVKSGVADQGELNGIEEIRNHAKEQIIKRLEKGNIGDWCDKLIDAEILSKDEIKNYGKEKLVNYVKQNHFSSYFLLRDRFVTAKIIDAQEIKEVEGQPDILELLEKHKVEEAKWRAEQARYVKKAREKEAEEETARSHWGRSDYSSSERYRSAVRRSLSSYAARSSLFR